jgi:DNA-binding PadR family transcriptional regulator
MAPANPVTTLGYAILGLLARGPLSGYDLAARLKQPVGYYWTAQHGQIHPELQRLVGGGLITYGTTHGPGPHAKKVYAITPSGREALRAWVTEPPRPRPVRDELVLKTASLWLADPAAALLLFRAEARRHAEQLANYEVTRARMEATHGAALERPGSPAFAEYLTLRCGISYETHRLNWCRWVIGLLEPAEDERGQGR